MILFIRYFKLDCVSDVYTLFRNVTGLLVEIHMAKVFLRVDVPC